MGKKIEYKCTTCGKTYYSYKLRSKFCSTECRNKYNRINYNCDYCGKDMIAIRSNYDKLLSGEKQGLYCSRKCVTDSQNKQVTKICEYCGKEYKIGNAFKDVQKYCSRDCYEQSRSKIKNA